MRTILIITTVILFFSNKLFAQSDYPSLDKLTYDYYLKGDYKNLKKTGNKMLSQGMDYYYLRMRMGILAYNNKKYPVAVKHFNKALAFSSLDTISCEYIYYSYLFSGRKADANLYLESAPWSKRNNTLRAIKKSGLSEIFVGSSVTSFDENLYATNSLYYETLKSSISVNAGFENYFSSNFKATFAYTYFRKSGTLYSSSSPSGTNLDFSQNQAYAKLTGMVFPGWEFSGFGHIALFSDAKTQNQQGSGRSASNLKTEFAGGVGVAKNAWRVRVGVNVSFSNFGNSSQIRGEGNVTYLPFGNLNFYLTSGGMYQNDKNWGSTYQINQEIGSKIFKFLWLEAGIINGNSFLYVRNQGTIMNNSYLIPATTVYSNFILLIGRKINITLTPYYTRNQNYSWDLSAYTRTNMLTSNSFGGNIKLTFKIY